MTTSEKVAYLKGLADGLGLDKDNKQDKLLAAVIEVLEAVAKDIDDLEDNALDLADEIDAISDDLSDIEEIVYNDYDYDDECDDECCCGGNDDDCCCGGNDHHHDEGCCCGHHHGDPVFYEVTCPACEKTITVDEDVLALGKIECPNCGEVLEFDMDSIEYEDSAPEKE